MYVLDCQKCPPTPINTCQDSSADAFFFLTNCNGTTSFTLLVTLKYDTDQFGNLFVCMCVDVGANRT